MSVSRMETFVLLRYNFYCGELHFPHVHSLRRELKLCGHFLHLSDIAIHSHVKSKKEILNWNKFWTNELRAFKMQMKGSRYQEVSSDNTLHDLHASSSDLRFFRMPPQPNNLKNVFKWKFWNLHKHKTYCMQQVFYAGKQKWTMKSVHW